mmetsp:Transcript_66075/g.141376  ORF Transcript_66075/g.141376 Transcript_66075/m.141376 type:complete len:419 (-) Transcript_66075:91-1347(-)
MAGEGTAADGELTRKPVASGSAVGGSAKPVEPELNHHSTHLLFPPRGPGRPTLRQVLSEPTLRKDFLGAPGATAAEKSSGRHWATEAEGRWQDFQGDLVTRSAVEKAVKSEREAYRGGIEDLMRGLDIQCAARKQDHRRRQQTEKALLRVENRNARFLKSEQERCLRPAWTYCDPSDYFERPMPIDNSEGLTYVKNRFLQGLYDTPEWKPPHWESNVNGGWNFHSRNDHGEVLQQFGETARHRMSPKEVMYATRAEEAKARSTELEFQDAVLRGERPPEPGPDGIRAMGKYKQQRVLNSMGDHSALKRTKKEWKEQQIATHTYFSSPPAYKPGDHEYETGLPEYVTQPERALSFKREFIAGDGERTSFWRSPKPGAVKGSTRRHTKAKELLCPPGCKALVGKSNSTGQLSRHMKQVAN